MAWTYSGDPAATSRDMVRWLIGDTDTNDQQVNDAEIAKALSDDSRVYFAAAICCEALASKYSRFEASAATELYQKRARLLRQQGNVQGATPYAGGISRAEIEAVEADTDKPTPYFNTGMHDYPGAGSTNEDLC